MANIGGNANCVLKYEKPTKTALGEYTTEWAALLTVKGFLDLMTNGKNYDAYNKAVSDSTHVFVCDYVNISKEPTELKAVINGKEYDVTYIDNPMGLNYHLEIFLKKVE